MRRRTRTLIRIGCVLLLLCVPLAPTPVRAAAEVDLYGRVVSVFGSSMTIDADGARLTLDVSEVDPTFLASLRPGDDVRVKAFRLPDGSLLVHSVFFQAREQAEPPAGPQGGPE